MRMNAFDTHSTPNYCFHFHRLQQHVFTNLIYPSAEIQKESTDRGKVYVFYMFVHIVSQLVDL